MVAIEGAQRQPRGRGEGVELGERGVAAPAEIYRAMLESSAMGMRYALDLHRQVGPVDEIRITGGMARFPAIMQLYADVIGQAVRANPMTLGSARGAAITAAIGAGWEPPPGRNYSDYAPHDSGRYAGRYQQYAEHIAQASPRGE